MEKIRVVAAVVDTRQLTMYLEDGSKHIIKQGDPRLKKIVDVVLPVISAGGIAEVDISSENDFRVFEEKSSGIVKFFKIAKSKIAEIFNPKEEAPAITVDVHIESPVPPPVVEPEKEPVIITQTAEEQSDQKGPGFFAPRAEPKIEKLKSAVDQIIENAVPVTDPRFHEDDKSKTVVAVVNGQVVAGVEQIQPQIRRAGNTENVKGIENFMKRIAPIIEKRRHSIDDLLKFMKHGDLPIADDGSILIYKLLNVKDKTKGTMVDIHSGNVIQRLGSYVVMDESMVDPDRRNDCSNGLHVATRGYLGAFGGNIMVLAKVAPEDVIAVPEYSHTKMRVCAYHIIDIVSEDSFRKLKNNIPMTDDDAAKLQLAKAIAGQHIGKIEEVRITQQKGGGLQIKPLEEVDAEEVVITPLQVSQAVAINPDNPYDGALPVDPKALSEEVMIVKEGVATSRKDTIAALMVKYRTADTCPDADDAKEEIFRIKKQAKVSWEKLGLSEQDQKDLGIEAPPAKVDRKAEVVVTKVTKTKPKSKAKKPVAKKAVKPVAKKATKEKTVNDIKAENTQKVLGDLMKSTDTKAPVDTQKPASGAFNDAQKLYKQMLDQQGHMNLIGQEHNVRALMAVKRKCKKNWSILGIPDAHGTRIAAKMRELEN